MRTDLSDITLVVDRSGSMQACQLEAENGANQFIKEQAEQPGDALLSLVQFDTAYEFVHRGRPIREVGNYKLEPRGMTALLDAVGRAINETGERISQMEESARPGLVVFCIITDGCENSSHEFTKGQIKEMVERQQREYSWQFTFLGANQDAFTEARSMGVPDQGTAAFSHATVDAAFGAASQNTSRMRHSAMSGQAVSNTYTDKERKAMSGK